MKTINISSGLYWYHRLKVKILQSLVQWAESKCIKAEDKMLNLAKRYDW